MYHTESGLVSLEVLARFHERDLDAETLRRKYAVTELSPQELLYILRDTGFRARLRTLRRVEDLKAYGFPLIVILRREKTLLYVPVLGIREGRVYYLDPLEKRVKALGEEEFAREWTGEVIPVAPRGLRALFSPDFSWLLREFLRYRGPISEILLASFFIQALALVTPLFLQIIVDKVLPNFALNTLRVVGLAFFLAVIFDGILSFLRNYLSYFLANKVDAGLGGRVYAHLLRLPFRYFEFRTVGNIVARIRELENLRQFMSSVLVSAVLDLLFSAVFVAVMLLYSVKLTLVALAFVLVLGLISVLTAPALKRLIDERFQKGAAVQSFLVESLTGILTVKALTVEGRMLRKWNDFLGDYILSSFRVANLANVIYTLSQTLQKLMILAILYVGVGEVLGRQLTIGQLVAFQMFASQLAAPLLRFIRLWQDFQQARVSLERVGDIVRTPPEAEGQGRRMQSLRGEIVFDRVSFRYSPEAPEVLREVSFRVPAGAFVGIVGPSGSGKSTLAKLLLRLYLPTGGRILLDGVDLRHLDPVFVRSQIGVVLQENFLFRGTIRENIALARPEATLDEIVRVATLAGAHEFISALPLGYETPVEERGESLSGGERQRIAIARALLTDPRILIFDEATSALDYESEKRIMETVQALSRGRTVLFIAHRLNLVRNCDFIVVLDRGRVVEIGPHEVLLRKGGLYSRLWRHQEGA